MRHDDEQRELQITMKRVFIVEDESNTRQLLCMVVSKHPKLELHTAAANLADARKAFFAHEKPDVFLVDLGLPDGSGIEFIQEIRRYDSEVAVMVLSVFGDERHVVDAIVAGAGGYIHKDEPLEEVGRHIEDVLLGDSPISPSIAKHILNRMNGIPDKKASQASSVLSEREVEVLNILSLGFSRSEVAQHLGISKHTITTHIKNIYSKLNVHSCTEAVFEANQLGLIGVHD